MKSGINPFDSQEAKPYKNDPEILAMTNLVVSYQNNDINEFESILRNNRSNIMADPFIREHIEGMSNLRSSFWENLILKEKQNSFRFVKKYPNPSANQIDWPLHSHCNSIYFKRIEHRTIGGGKFTGFMHFG